MPRSGTLGNPQPYLHFGTYAGLPFWGGGLTLTGRSAGYRQDLLAAAHALSSLLLRQVPSAIGCYEHTPEELRYRMYLQVEALISGPHDPANEKQVETALARASEAVLLHLSYQEDTVRALEDTLLHDYGFPLQGPALLAVDYLNRVPVVGLTGMLGEEGRSGEAAAALRALARHHGWAVIAAAALKSENFTDGDDLSALLGDERVPYEADRVLLVQRSEAGLGLRLRAFGSAHAQRPHRSRPALADPVLGRALLSRPGVRISPSRENCLMDATLSTLVLFLREAWTALAGALLGFCGAGRHGADPAIWVPPA